MIETPSSRGKALNGFWKSRAALTPGAAAQTRHDAPDRASRVTSGATRPGPHGVRISDKNDVVCQRTAVEPVNTEADGSPVEGLAVDPPCRIRVLENEVRDLESLVGDPERYRPAWHSDVDDDPSINVKAKITARERETLAGTETRQKRVTASRDGAQLAF